MSRMILSDAISLPLSFAIKHSQGNYMSDDIFSVIAKEIETGNTDSGLWTRAFAESDGDEAKTKAKYIRLRHAILSSASAGGSEKPSPAIASLPPRDPSISPAVLELRGKLKKLLTDTPKTTFYSTLGLSAACSDADIVAAVAPLRAREASGEILPSDLRYAIDAIADPADRQKYDQRLLGLLSSVPTSQPTTTYAGPPVSFGSSNKGRSRIKGYLIAIGVVIMVGGVTIKLLPSKSPATRVAGGSPSAQEVAALAAAAQQRSDQQARQQREDREREIEQARVAPPPPVPQRTDLDVICKFQFYQGDEHGTALARVAKEECLTNNGEQGPAFNAWNTYFARKDARVSNMKQTLLQNQRGFNCRTSGSNTYCN